MVRSLLVRVALRLVPADWRDSVYRDLADEARRAGRTGAWREVWLACEAVRIGGRLRMRARRRRSPRWPGLTRGLRADLRFAARALTRHRWSTAAVVLTLGLGIGATTAVYAVFNYAVFRPVPGIGDESGLVSVFVAPDHASTWRATLTHAHLRAVREMPAFEGVAAYRPSTVPFEATPGSAPESRKVTVVTRGYFDVLQVRPAIGRLFADEEYERPGHAIAVISERLWRSRYGADPATIGRDASILQHRFTIVGVARDFRGLDQIGEEDVWVPYGAASLLDADRVREHQRMVGRLAPGATLEAAREQAAAACAATGAIQRGDQRYTAVVFPGLSDGLGVTRGRLMRIYWTATAGAAVLFLLACANAAHLLMSRNIGRRRDLALKAAIGASRARVCRGLLVEAALVAMLAAGVGFMACLAMTSAFRSDRLLTYLPTLEGLAVDWRVGLYTTALAAITVLLAAGLPSLLASRADPQRGLSEFARGASRGGRRLREGFVAVQVALSIALVASAGVLAQTLIHLETKDLGFDQGVLVAPLRPRVLGYDAASITQFHHEVEDRLSAAPGIEAAAFGWASHLAYQNTVEVEALDRRALPQPGHAFYVSSEYLTTLNAPLVAGRMFTRAEARADNAPVVVVDESLATAMFGSEPAAGRYLRLTTFDTPVLHEVIGVVRDTGWRDFREGPRPALYLPAGQSLPIATMHVRSRLPSAEAAALIRRIVREVEPALPVDTVTTLGEEVRQIAAEERLLAKLGLVLAALALGMAAAGIHAAVACGVGEQKREFGIRMALGASRGAVGRGVLGRVLLATSAGMLAGLALYVWASRFIEARLYEISRLDAATLGAAMAILTSAALLAAWLPTRRATRVDPTIALRAE